MGWLSVYVYVGYEIDDDFVMWFFLSGFRASAATASNASVWWCCDCCVVVVVCGCVMVLCLMIEDDVVVVVEGLCILSVKKVFFLRFSICRLRSARRCVFAFLFVLLMSWWNDFLCVLVFLMMFDWFIFGRMVVVVVFWLNCDIVMLIDFENVSMRNFSTRAFCLLIWWDVGFDMLDLFMFINLFVILLNCSVYVCEVVVFVVFVVLGLMWMSTRVVSSSRFYCCVYVVYVLFLFDLVLCDVVVMVEKICEFFMVLILGEIVLLSGIKFGSAFLYTFSFTFSTTFAFFMIFLSLMFCWVLSKLSVWFVLFNVFWCVSVFMLFIVMLILFNLFAFAFAERCRNNSGIVANVWRWNFNLLVLWCMG